MPSRTTLALVAVALTSAGSVGPVVTHFAQEVCIGVGQRADGLGSVADSASYDKGRTHYEAAAALSAKAAKADNKWNALATALSDESDVSAEGAIPVAHGFAGTFTPADQLGDVLEARVSCYGTTIRTECLKENA